MDRRFYVLMGVIAAVFCAGAIFLGVDTQSVTRRCIVKQKQEVTALNEQMKQHATQTTVDEVVVAGY
jgi:hypothetical protein